MFTNKHICLLECKSLETRTTFCLWKCGSSVPGPVPSTQERWSIMACLQGAEECQTEDTRSPSGRVFGISPPESQQSKKTENIGTNTCNMTKPSTESHRGFKERKADLQKEEAQVPSWKQRSLHGPWDCREEWGRPAIQGFGCRGEGQRTRILEGCL